MESLHFRTGSGSIPIRTPLPPGHGGSDSSWRISQHVKVRRSYSESDVTAVRTLGRLGSLSFTAASIPEVECDDEMGSSGGGGMNKSKHSGGGRKVGDAERHEIGAYYQRMLESDPTNSLLLRNYGKYLHEVERDVVKAEEYYGRAILASPDDGELLLLYGKLIWETGRDEERAKPYFDQALLAFPQDSMVLGSYAHFLWEAEKKQEEDEQVREMDLSY